MITSALERRRLAVQPDRKECIACGGSGTSSKGGECVACKGTGSIPKSNYNKPVQHSSESVEHYTPIEIVEAARTVLGGIDLDPASCSTANEVVKAAAWYGPGSEFGEDGLAEPWLGRVFLNPPGGVVPEAHRGCGTKSNAALWWAYLAEAWRTGEVDAAIFVGFTLEVLRSTQALDVPQPLDFPLCVPFSRIAFDTLEGGRRVPSSQPTHANVIVFLPTMGKDPKGEGRAEVRRFVDAFTPIGRCRA